MQSINSVTISGNLTRDVELRTTQAGTEVANFTIAVTENRKNASTGEWTEVAHFIRCIAWGSNARVAVKFRKGDLAHVQGRLQYRTWEAQDSTRRETTEVKVDVISGEAMFRKADGSGPDRASARRDEPSDPWGTSPIPDDDIPF